ncbi:AraC family transcriptional regulator [bacterium]|nr:AraC family transcriptional regulator [bacterium]
MLPSHLAQLPLRVLTPLFDPSQDETDYPLPLHMGRERRLSGELPYSWDNQRRAPRDGKPYCVFQYTLSGQGVFRDESGAEQAVGEGQAFLALLPSRTSYWMPTGGDWGWLWLNFRGDTALSLVRTLIERHGHVLTLGHASGPIRLLAEFYQEATEGEILSVYHASAGLYRFLMELADLFLSHRRDHPTGVTKALRLVRDRLGDPALCLDDLAREARLSRYYFSRLFTRTLGQSPGRYIEEQRMHRALELLSFTHLPVKEVARYVVSL